MSGGGDDSGLFGRERVPWLGEAVDAFLAQPDLAPSSRCSFAQTLARLRDAVGADRPLARAWGAGRLSSSDGQRFATRTRGPGVAALPRYFGHRRRGLQIYSWTSDQYSQYSSKVVAATVRDATQTLDGILDNQTVLPIEEHTTDTHGYTEMIFGVYDLLGLRFAPRIRDLTRQRLYRHGPSPAVETAELLRHKLRPELITPYWDELLRLAASLRHGWAPASLLLARLQAGSRRNPLAQALQEYGRLVKTNFVLAWLADQELRARIGRQLNKGEQLHALRRAIFYANEGHIRQRTPDRRPKHSRHRRRCWFPERAVVGGSGGEVEGVVAVDVDVPVGQRGDPFDLAGREQLAAGAELVEDALGVDGVPDDDCVDDYREAERLLGLLFGRSVADVPLVGVEDGAAKRVQLGGGCLIGRNRRTALVEVRPRLVGPGGGVGRRAGNVLCGVALLDERDRMVGSVMIVDFADREAVDGWLQTESYVIGGVWQAIDVEPCWVGRSFVGLHERPARA